MPTSIPCFFFVVIFSGIVLLSGCGQKGPLYIEQNKGPSADDTTHMNKKQNNGKPS